MRSDRQVMGAGEQHVSKTARASSISWSGRNLSCEISARSSVRNTRARVLKTHFTFTAHHPTMGHRTLHHDMRMRALLVSRTVSLDEGAQCPVSPSERGSPLHACGQAGRRR